ncbi:DUF6629 family protein [Methylophaga thalassica]|uniref:DUF6629 family protein n=1 Tax=Methylophaga thalassica TaxID=40223 RepID=UPI002E7AB7E1|nr:DUF6629 family protein [Methylophaga thalassica]WVI83771.1 DUF6629 family protein [Methylophaga thalassica]
MCFSATASLTAAAFLVGVGTVTLRKVERRAELPFAAIPFLFAVQQLTEGLLWLGFSWQTIELNFVLTQLYSFFSHVLWPVYVPIAIWLLEPPGYRRNLLSMVCMTGLAVGLYLLYTLFAYPIHAHPFANHIEYDSPHFYIGAVMAAYLSATTASMLLSSHRTVRFFGLLALTAAVLAYLFYARWFISVWCFFAALTSISVYLYFAARKPVHGTTTN